MKLRVFLVVLLMAFSKTSIGDDFYVGMDVGDLSFDQQALSSATNYGLVLGHRWDSWSLEAVINSSETDNVIYKDQSVDMYHLYGAYRTSGKYYLKLKAGLTYEKYSFHHTAFNKRYTDEHVGIARGIGLGAKFAPISIELEYSWLGGSLELVNLGMRYSF